MGPTREVALALYTAVVPTHTTACALVTEEKDLSLLVVALFVLTATLILCHTLSVALHKVVVALAALPDTPDVLTPQ